MCMKKTNSACCCIFTILSIIIGATGIAAIFYAGLITSITILLYITLILGVLEVLYIVFLAFCGRRHQVKAIKNSCIIPTAVGSIVTSIFAITATTLATFSIATALLIGTVAFFLISSLINLVYYVVEKIDCDECE